MKVLKVLIHKLTPAQVEELANDEIVELAAIAPEVAKFLSDTPNDWDALNQKANELVDLAKDYDAVLLPGGSPAFAWELAKVWVDKDVKAKPMFAHSVRNSVEKLVDKFVPIEGTDQFRKETVVEKATVFNHVRFF